MISRAIPKPIEIRFALLPLLLLLDKFDKSDIYTDKIRRKRIIHFYGKGFSITVLICLIWQAPLKLATVGSGPCIYNEKYDY